MVYTIEERLSFEVKRTTAAAAAADDDDDLSVRRKPAPSKRSLMFRYFSVGAVILMALLTVSLLLLPLVLPPLPPPPLTLLLVPVAIMAVLVFLAFAPPQLPNAGAIDHPSAYARSIN